MLIRKLVLSPGPYADTDWTDPAVTPPDNARRFKIVSSDMRFALRGRASSADDAVLASLGVMTVDAYVLIELADGGVTRGKTIVEVEGSPLAGQIFLRSSGLPLGTVGRLHLDLVNVSAAVVEFMILDGGRPL